MTFVEGPASGMSVSGAAPSGAAGVGAPAPAGKSTPQAAPVASAPGGSGDVALGDWDVLMDAVSQRLRQIAASGPAGAPWQAGVLECASALAQLQTTLQHAGVLSPWHPAAAGVNQSGG